MNKYSELEVKVTKFDLQDVITASNDSEGDCGCCGGNNGRPGQGGEHHDGHHHDGHHHDGHHHDGHNC